MTITSIEDGIRESAKTCECGHKLRIHTYTFKKDSDTPEPKYYLDCPHCGYVGNWQPIEIVRR